MMRGIILQQEADNRARLRLLNHITRGITDKRLAEICDAERRRIMKEAHDKLLQEAHEKTPVPAGAENAVVHVDKLIDENKK